MFDRFTDRAKKVMALSRQESTQLQHEYIGTEHILLGIVREGGGVAATVLKDLSFDLGKIRAEVERSVTRGRAPVVANALPFTPRAKRVLELAMKEASGLAHNYIGTEHLLLGLIAERDGIAGRVLRALGAELAEVREQIGEFLGAAGPRHLAPELGPDGSARFEKRMLDKLVAPVHLEIRAGLAYVVIGSDPRSEQVLREAIVPALSRLGLEVVRSEDLGAPDARLAQAWQRLCTAELVLIAPRGNANLTYLLGFCHGALRCPLLLVESAAELPPCMRTLPRIDYGTDAAATARLAHELEHHVSNLRRVRDSGQAP